MKRQSEFDEVEAEARRMAATAALHGSPAMRSGSTNVPLLEVRRIAQRILAEAQAAQFAWANWEAINTAMGGEASVAANFCRLDALAPVRNALVRDSLLRSFRLSDVYASKSHADKITLCRLADDFRSDADRFDSEQWALDLGYKPGVAVWAASKNKERRLRFSSQVVPNWKTKPDDPSLLECRKLIKPLRDTALAHFEDVADIPQPTVDQIGRLVNMTLDLATDAAFVLVGTAVSAESFREFTHRESTRLWEFAFEAPTQIRREHASAPGFAEDGSDN